jgi:hypothetical protein
METLTPESEIPSSPEPAQPRMALFYGLLAALSLCFSYLGAYAISGVMVANNLLSPWPADHDPRPWWLLAGFSGLMGIFLAIASLLRHLSRRQLKRIDAMSEEG